MIAHVFKYKTTYHIYHTPSFIFSYDIMIRMYAYHKSHLENLQNVSCNLEESLLFTREKLMFYLNIKKNYILYIILYTDTPHTTHHTHTLLQYCTILHTHSTLWCNIYLMSYFDFCLFENYLIPQKKSILIITL